MTTSEQRGTLRTEAVTLKNGLILYRHIYQKGETKITANYLYDPRTKLTATTTHQWYIDYLLTRNETRVGVFEGIIKGVELATLTNLVA